MEERLKELQGAQSGKNAKARSRALELGALRLPQGRQGVETDMVPPDEAASFIDPMFGVINESGFTGSGNPMMMGGVLPDKRLSEATRRIEALMEERPEPTEAMAPQKPRRKPVLPGRPRRNDPPVAEIAVPKRGKKVAIPEDMGVEDDSMEGSGMEGAKAYMEKTYPKNPKFKPSESAKGAGRQIGGKASCSATIGGASASDKRKARGQAVSRLMKEKGMTLGQASAYIKKNGY